MDEERVQRRECVLSLVPGCSSGDETGSDLVRLDCYAHLLLLLPGEKWLPASRVSQRIVPGHRLCVSPMSLL